VFHYLFSSQIDFTISIDEILITFILGSLFISNNEANSDFILSEKADLLIVEKIVAPLFVSNIGKDVAENGALYIKVCTIFSFVLFSNLLGIIPYGDTATSSLILTF
jgi:F0F1-type ATP synthase membrane subunit a